MPSTWLSYSYGLYSHGRYSYGQYSYGVYSLLSENDRTAVNNRAATNADGMYINSIGDSSQHPVQGAWQQCAQLTKAGLQ